MASELTSAADVISALERASAELNRAITRIVHEGFPAASVRRVDVIVSVLYCQVTRLSQLSDRETALRVRRTLGL